MRVLFTVSDHASHYFPMVPLGWALQAAGHDVRVVCSPRESATVSSAGLVPVPLLGGPDMMLRGRIYYYLSGRQQGGTGPLGMPLHPVTAEQLTDFDEFDWFAYKRDNDDRDNEAIRRGLDETVAFARAWRPDLVVHDLVTMEGILAAQVTGVPAVCHLWGPVGPDETEPGTILVPRDHTGAFERHGVAPMSPELIRHVIDPCPPEIAAPVRAERLPVRFVPYNGPGELPSWALDRPARPRVCVVWGHSLVRLLGPKSFILPRIAEALSTLDAEILFACHPDAVAALGTLPDNARLLGYVPLNLVLPTCDAIVHNSGSGCLMTAASAGTPQLALRFTPESGLTARRIGAAGVAIAQDGAATGPLEIRAAVRELLEGAGYRKAAAELSAEMAARPSPAQLVGDLAELAAARA